MRVAITGSAGLIGGIVYDHLAEIGHDVIGIDRPHADWINAGAIGPDDDDNGIEEDIYGCTDPIAENYNSDATQDDGSCTYPPLGELSFSNFIDIPNDEIDYASFNIELNCQYPVSEFELEISGIDIQNIIGLNEVLSFDLSYTDSTIIGVSNGEYIPSNSGPIIEIHHLSDFENINPIICFENSNITTSIGIEYEAILGDCLIPGCVEENACNFDINATIDDGSCLDPCESTLDINIDLHYGANLISFYAIPDDNSVSKLF